MANTPLENTPTTRKQTGRVSKRGDKYFWKPEDKHRGVAAYVSTGSFTKSASITGIPEMTLRAWARQDWFQEEMLRVKRADTEELQSTATRIAKRAFDELENRLEHGETYVTKDGEERIKKVGARDAAIIAAVAIDKRKILLETPAHIAVQTNQEKLTKLMEEFLKFAKAKEIVSEKVSREAIDLDLETSGESPGGFQTAGDSDATGGTTPAPSYRTDPDTSPSTPTGGS